MKNRHDQLNIEYVETKNVSPFIKYTCILFILIFAFIPLAELIDVLDYNYAAPNTVDICIFEWRHEPLQFKPLPQQN